MRRLIVALLVLAGAVCSAQTPLYRGRAVLEYNFPFNGHYFWTDPEFRPGTVYFNGERYEGAMLNVNVHTGVCQAFGHSVAGRSQTACNMRREFPAEHQDSHNASSLSLY